MTRSLHLVLTAAFAFLLAASSARATDGLRYVEMQKTDVNGVPPLNGARGVALSPDGRHLYAVAKTDDAIVVFSRDNATGHLTLVESQTHATASDGLDGASAVTVSPDGLHVYVASYVDDSVVAFSRNADTGALTWLERKHNGEGKVTGLNGAEAIALSPDGKFIYVAATNSDAVAVFARDAVTGTMKFATTIVQ